MLLPKRVKYRRPHRLSYEGKAKAGTEVDKANSVYKLVQDVTLLTIKSKQLVFA